MARAVFIGILVLFVFVSCKRDKMIDQCPYAKKFTEITATAPPENGLFALNTKNYWVYADTAWNNAGTIIYSGIDTIRFQAVKLTEGETWWWLNGSYALHQNNDHVYVLDSYGWADCKYKRLDYFPVTGDTVEKRNLYEGDIMFTRKGVLMSDTVYTPAGNFSECHFYQYQNVSQELVKPGLGFIKTTSFYYGKKSRELTLLSYHIE